LKNIIFWLDDSIQQHTCHWVLEIHKKRFRKTLYFKTKNQVVIFCFKVRCFFGRLGSSDISPQR